MKIHTPLTVISLLLGYAFCVHGQDKSLLSERLPNHIKIIQKLLEFATTTNDIKESDDEENKRLISSIDTIIDNEKDIQSLKELAILVWHTGMFGTNDSDKDATWRVFLKAFKAITSKISDNTTDEAVNAMKAIYNNIRLDGGEGLEFRRYQEKQQKLRDAKPNDL